MAEGSANEYIRDLVRGDYEQEEAHKWAALRRTLNAGLESRESDFVELDTDKLIAEATSRNKKDGR